MKKVKFMLTAVTILAVVGGALAFKASNKFGNLSYCTRDLESGSTGKCTSYVTNSREAASGIQFFAVETENTANCTSSAAPDCNIKLTITSQE